MSKIKHSAKLNTTQKKAIKDALKALRAHVDPIAALWSQLSIDQRAQLLRHSPLLAEFVECAKVFN